MSGFSKLAPSVIKEKRYCGGSKSPTNAPALQNEIDNQTLALCSSRFWRQGNRTDVTFSSN